MSYSAEPGVYRVKVKRLNVRGTKDTSNEGNFVKVNSKPIQLTEGKEFPVYAVEVDDKGWIWGVITPPGAPQAHYVCLWNINTVFATNVRPLVEQPPVPVLQPEPGFTIAVSVNLAGVVYSGTLTRNG